MSRSAGRILVGVGAAVFVGVAPGACGPAEEEALDGRAASSLSRAMEHAPPPCDSGCPDLYIHEDRLQSSVYLEETYIGAEDCALEEGCASGVGMRRLLRFTTMTTNAGETDLVLGEPDGHDHTHYHDCHEHHHVLDYVAARLLSPSGEVVVASSKQSFCLMDGTPWAEDAGPAQYDCDYQGISVGWSDTYVASLDCQWIDVTGVPPGSYILELEVNPSFQFPEMDYDNNFARAPIELDDSGDGGAQVGYVPQSFALEPPPGLSRLERRPQDDGSPSQSMMRLGSQ